MILRETKKVSALTWDENFAVPPNFTDKQPLARYGAQAPAARKAEPARTDTGSQPPGSLGSMRRAVIFRRRREIYSSMDSITHFTEKVKPFAKKTPDSGITQKGEAGAPPFVFSCAIDYFLFAIHAEPSRVTSTMRPPPIMEPQPLFALLITSLAAS